MGEGGGVVVEVNSRSMNLGEKFRVEKSRDAKIQLNFGATKMVVRFLK